MPRGRKPLNLSDEEKKIRKQIANRKYRQSEKGSKKTKEANLRYQDNDEYREYKRNYERNRRKQQNNI